LHWLSICIIIYTMKWISFLNICDMIKASLLCFAAKSVACNMQGFRHLSHASHVATWRDIDIKIIPDIFLINIWSSHLLHFIYICELNQMFLSSISWHLLHYCIVVLLTIFVAKIYNVIKKLISRYNKANRFHNFEFV